MKYSLLSLNKWNFKDFKILFSSDDFTVAINKYRLVLKYTKYIKQLSPKNSLHRISNLRVFNKIYKELHTKEQIFPGDILKPNLIVLRDNETNLIISVFRFHNLMGGIIPNPVSFEYLQEREEVAKNLSSLWQDYERTYNYKYFDLR